MIQWIKDRDWLVRALKTYVQAFFGVLVPEIVALLNGNLFAIEDWAKVLIPIISASLAAGISAVWNYSKAVLEKYDEDEKTEK